MIELPTEEYIEIEICLSVNGIAQIAEHITTGT